MLIYWTNVDSKWFRIYVPTATLKYHVCVQNVGGGQNYGTDPVPPQCLRQRRGRDAGRAQDGLSGASSGAL